MMKERRESRLSCKLCGSWSEADDKVSRCPECGQGWHHRCLVPALITSPSQAWQCPLCSHLNLVTSLEHLLTELNSLIETVEQKRLAELQVKLDNSGYLITL